ncbi:histidine kinase [Herbaspirillum rubrisubalbicans]|jgi:nitrogen fixation/metabolism regulation signal transduction histidine kinase|uniref:histidine kinase n=2 Tax=Herbaspirillum rubrisubalbicans TaxID=80842 RepID=A0ABX9BY64_9BURK|nr:MULTISPECIES: ATP-binding protein [Herbaspirillum]MCP1575445.1 nitrogen fixation/metabolism regulation signal transduction histidine kinase [Herbaspirillum rubrisubalbicans]QJP98759.1 PAS domain-containing sensor histidine kinase [Herbaspirillum rubrisubalbicans Os34]RAM62900.1 histidine kinase [Herbaspirillum rubrisubalbicans]RAN46668.1 histidine kinase [Herbaspirillum rubrisubalbicans]
MSRTLRYLLVVGGGVISILLFLLASASENSALFEQHYPWLLFLNGLAAISLLGLVLLLLGRLYKRYRRGKFGSKLLARLVLMFALVGIVPGAVIYLMSVQFVSRSIESWFDVRMEAALESGLNLGRNALDSSLSDLVSRARGMAQELSDMSDSEQVTYLSRQRDQNMEITIVNANGQVMGTVGGSIGSLTPTLPSPQATRQARVSRAFSAVESDDTRPPNGESDSDGNLRLHVVVLIPAPSRGMSLQNETRYLQILQPVPDYLASNAETLRLAYNEYQQRSVSRSGLRKIYLVTLTLTLLLAIFAAIASAFLIASDLAKPLLLLAEGTKAVAEGNLSPRPIVSTSDELGTLTQSFNTMTRQLLEARTSVEKNRAELENAKAYLESVLANMSAGVMVLDGQFNIVSANDSVRRILGYDFSANIGTPLQTIDSQAPFAQAIIRAFSEQLAQHSSDGADGLHWQRQFELSRQPGAVLDANDEQGGKPDHDKLTLLARGSHLPVENGVGYVVVFDDISNVISAQRSIAWGEVARRLAHEIKNPLTPIQLSAERLQHRLADKLMPADAAILDKGTTTIVNQVTAMKRMVDDFRDYAKTPPAKPVALDLNALIEEILNLYLAGDGRDVIHARLAPEMSKVMGDATQMRQVIHNLLQNAQDAVTDDGQQAPRIDVLTEQIDIAGTNGQRQPAVRLSIMDNGPGFSPTILARAFEPYVTSKARGTGLGLAMVKKIVEEHGGRIDIQNRTDGRGAKIVILLVKLAPID